MRAAKLVVVAVRTVARMDSRDWLSESPASRVELRDYQRRAVEAVDRAVAAGNRKPLLVLPTGAGKTVVAAELINRALERGGRAMFLAPRRELVEQASRAIARLGIRHGLILAGDRRTDGYAKVQVASIDTLLARMIRTKRLEVADPTLVIVDEAHLSVTKIRAELLDRWPNAVRVGLTATPTRKDGRALGMLYDELLEGATVAQLVEAGHLAKARYFAPSTPDLRGVEVIAGDYNQGQLAGAVNRPKLIADVVATWLEKAADRRTAVFATSVAHSIALRDEFLRSGIAAEHADGSTPIDLRAAIFDRFANGKTQVLCNCELATYGFDLPAMDCVVLAKPTRSLMKYLQMLGRGLRVANGKADCLVLDHSGAVHRFGFADVPRIWTLEGEFALTDAQGRVGARGDSGRPITCPECSAVFVGSLTCPECGYHLEVRAKPVAVADGQLVEMNAPGDRLDDRADFYAELRAIGAERNWKPTAAAAQFRERFGVWPPKAWNFSPTKAPSSQTRRWLQSRLIAWRKGQQSRQAGAR